MTHLNEGAIHAWLDGALSAAEARDAEAHIDGCAECSAKVAEARGFIAGASRILTALDDVPAGVTPKRAASTAPAVRHWRAAPWVTGIAATLVLAIGVATWRKQPQESALRLTTQPRAPIALADSARAIAPEPSVATNAPSAISRARAAAPPVAPPRPAASMAGAGVASVAEGALRADAEERAGVLAAAVGAGAKRAEALPAASAMKDARDDAALARSRDVEAAGCYRVDVPRALQLEVAPRAMAARAPAAAIDAPAVVPAMVRLDTTVTARGYVATDVRPGAPLGVWSRTGDSLRVELPSLGTFTVRAAAKLRCP